MTEPSSNDPMTYEEEEVELIPSPWPKRLKVSAGVILLLLLVGYFVIGSSFFVRSFVLPSIEKSMLAKIQVDGVSLSPFSQIELKDLTFTPNDGETLVSAEGALVRYSLFSILGGTIKLNQVQLTNPQVTIIEEEDGASNLTSWLESLPPSPSAPLPVLDLNDLSIENGKLIIRQKISGGGNNVTEIALNKVTIGKLGQDLEGSLNLDVGANISQTDSTGEETNLSLSLSLGGDLGLNEDMLPKKSTINGHLKVDSASGAYSDMVGVTGDLNFALQPGNIEDISLSMTRNGQAAGNIQVKGPLNFATTEGRIVASFENLNRQFLNLAGAIAGIDFKETVMDGTLTMTFTNGGNLLALDANTKGSNFSLGLGESVTPPLNLEVDTVLNYDGDGGKLVIQQFELNVVDGTIPTVSGVLSQPVTFVWNGKPESFQEPVFNLNITNFNIGSWQDFTANTVKKGELFGDFVLKVQQSGARVQANFNGGLEDTDVEYEGHIEKDTSAALNMQMIVEDYTRFSLNRMEATWLNSVGDSLATFSTSGSYATGSDIYNVRSDGKANLVLLSSFLNMEGLTIDEGGGEFSARFQNRNEELSGVVQTTLRDYTGELSGMPFNKYTVSLSSECSLRGQQFKLGSTKVEFQEDFSDGGSIGFRGEMDLKDKVGSFSVKSTGINRFAIGPFLSPFSNPEDLADVALNMEANLQVNLLGESTFKGTTSLSNLRVKDPETEELKNLESELNLDLAWNSEKLDIRPSTLKLSPTPLGGNVIKLNGKLPLVPSMSATGNLNVESPSMDLTSYYNLISTNSGEPEDSTDAEPIENSLPAAEPAPLEVPLGEFDMKLNVAKLIVRDLSIKSLQAHALWQTNSLAIRPLSMTINDGPVSAEMAMDFTKPDWGYNLSFEADKVPVQAFTDTLDPSTKGQVSGMFSGKATWKGTGITEPALQQNLNGSMSLNYSDANIELVSPKVRLLLTPITALLRLPELLKAPINGIETNMKVENQTLGLESFKVQSDAFQVHALGEIPLDNVLTNSVLNLPVGFYLERSIARKSNLIPSSAPKDTPYVKLPDFAKVEGTIGAPETKTDKLVLSGLLMKSAAGLPLNVGEGAVNVLKGVGGLLTGDSKKSDDDSGKEKNPDENSGILEQVNPLKLFNNLRNRGDKNE